MYWINELHKTPQQAGLVRRKTALPATFAAFLIAALFARRFGQRLRAFRTWFSSPQSSIANYRSHLVLPKPDNTQHYTIQLPSGVLMTPSAIASSKFCSMPQDSR